MVGILNRQIAPQCVQCDYVTSDGAIDSFTHDLIPAALIFLFFLSVTAAATGDRDAVSLLS
jgi:hypothetical protein